MYVDILILSHLVVRPSHGYEIKKSVERILGSGFAMNNNLLYPALRRFEEMGAVEREIERQEGKPDRHVYRATELGAAILQDMLREFPAQTAHNDAEFQTRVAFFGSLEPEDRLRILKTREEVLKTRLEHLSKMSPKAQNSDERSYAERVIELRRGQAQHELEWIGELAREVKEQRPRVS